MFSQHDLVQVNFPQPLKNLEPEKIYTLVVELKNNQESSITLRCVLSSSPEFQLSNPTKSITFKPFEKKITLFTFKVGRNVKAAHYNVALQLFNDNKLLSEVVENISVKAIYKINIGPVRKPDYIRLENTFYCEYKITNEGNQAEALSFDSFNYQKISPTTINLAPDSTALVQVYQKVPKISQKTIIVNTIYAKIAKVDTVFSSQTTIDVFPTNENKTDLYHRFPITFSSSYNSLKGIENMENYRYFIDGIGYLDKDQKHFLDFNYTGPSNSDLLRFGIYEKYHLRYKSKKIEATIGDINYTMSPITEFSRNGKGGLVYYSSGKFNTSIFYLEPRFTHQIKKSMGGKLGVTPFKNMDFQLGLLTQTLFENNEEFNSTIYNLSTNYIGTFYKLGGEIALENNYKSDGYAYSFYSALAFDNFNFETSWQYSDKNYLGYLRNSQQFSLNTHYKFSKALTIGGQLYHSYINPVKDSINYSTSPKITRNQFYINLNINKSNSIRIGVLHNTTEDLILPKKFDFEEQLLNLTYNYRSKSQFNINSFTRFGKSINNLSTDKQNKQVVFSTLQLTKSFKETIEVGLTGDFQRTNKISMVNELTNSFFYGGFIRFHYLNKLNLNLFYRSDYNTDELAEPQSYLEGKITYTPHPMHQFTITASESVIPSLINNKELLVSFGYNLKLFMPLYKDKTKGEIHGRIISKNSASLEGIILQLNDMVAITNKLGEFSFYSLLPDDYYLSVRQSSLPKNKIIYESLPQVITVVPNKKTLLTYNLGDGFIIKGKIELTKPVTSIDNQQEIKLPSVVVKISDENKVFLTKTDEKGNFEFKELNYGNWKVELLVKHLVNDYQFETLQKTIEIKDERNNNIIFKVTNRPKEVIRSQKQFKL